MGGPGEWAVDVKDVTPLVGEAGKAKCSRSKMSLLLNLVRAQLFCYDKNRPLPFDITDLWEPSPPTEEIFQIRTRDST